MSGHISVLSIPSEEAVRLLGLYVTGCGYTANYLIDEMEIGETLRADLQNLEPLLEKTRGISPLHLLARLFFVGRPANADDCFRILHPAALSTALACGLLRQSGLDLEPQALLIPFKELVIACDGVTLYQGSDIVMGPSSSTRSVLYSAVPGDYETTLDLCTGTGVLALNAAAYSRRVVGTDVNPRALQFARFSAALNGMDNVEFLSGNAFEPVQGRAFSRIIANPPFFLSPAQTFTFSDSPLALDGFVQKLATGAPALLADDGFFQMTCEWVQIEGEHWQERLQAWTRESGCDVLVLRGSQRSPIAYAEKTANEAKLVAPNRADSEFAGRLSSLRSARVETIFGGIVTMRKRRGANWFAALEAGELSESTGSAIREKFDSLTVLASHSDQDLLNATFRFAAGCELIQRAILGQKGWEVTNSIVNESTLKDQVRLDPVVFQSVKLFDGHRSTREIAHIVAQQLGISNDEAQQRCVQLVRRMLQGSFIHSVPDQLPDAR